MLQATVRMAFSPFSSSLVHPQLQHTVANMSLLDAIIFYIIHLVDKFGAWHRLPVLLGLAYLGMRRHLHQRYNLLHVGGSKDQKYDTREFSYRTADGTCNHPLNYLVGSQGRFFGRNMPPATSGYGLLEPHPSIIAKKLLERRKFVDCGKQFNMIACSWIQFMIHDWIDHMEDTEQVEIRAPDEVAEGCPLKSFRFYKNKKVQTGSPKPEIGFLNSRTPWWDGSVIYGNNNDGMIKVRTFKDGKLKISGDGLLEHDEKGIPISGDVRNCWAGFSLLQALFVKEHNVVCDMLKEHCPDLDDEKLYRHARLVTSAVIAKIHTIDWTVELLKTDTLLAGMRINWYGFFGKKIKDLIGHKFGPVCSGLVGLRRPRDHGIPYSLTEEFVGVYRMHSLLPDKVILLDIKSATSENRSTPVQEEVPMWEMIGKQGERRLAKIGMEQMLISMGHQSCGAVTLWNYPSWMRNLVAHDADGEDRPDRVDMAALEIYRDRERNVARYNEFRRNMLMIPISTWEDLTDDEEVIEALHEIYGDDVEKLDLQVGLHAEKKIKGFAISETAFSIFLLIASRRLEADRFFTTNFNSSTYTDKGLEWVNKTETLKDVIDRHFPKMTGKWMRCSSAFSLWSSDPTPRNCIPLYLRPASACYVLVSILACFFLISCFQ
ncbi:alpha-dioxygenase 2 isoform X2 [Olea europaea var. sylvestris]|uniref:alpha-dioxygenase 2 isoform X2 n=1 Tax=Olea europaea var. sylvestris TaxID=158386 RepID=UPI000C1D55D4|nr:alpha-dioxygenase 2 isoform X2 [Olea europaea var. sylvestris]